MSNVPTHDPRRSPIADRLRATPPARTPPAPPRAAPTPVVAPVKPKVASTVVEDFYLELGRERGTKFTVRFMSGDQLDGCVIVAVHKYALVLRAADGRESYAFKHGITRLERTGEAHAS